VDVADIDFNNRTSNVASVRTANITLIVLVSFFVILRLLVRGFMVRKIFADDGMHSLDLFQIFTNSLFWQSLLWLELFSPSHLLLFALEVCLFVIRSTYHLQSNLQCYLLPVMKFSAGFFLCCSQHACLSRQPLACSEVLVRCMLMLKKTPAYNHSHYIRTRNACVVFHPGNSIRQSERLHSSKRTMTT